MSKTPEFLAAALAWKVRSAAGTGTVGAGPGLREGLRRRLGARYLDGDGDGDVYGCEAEVPSRLWILMDIFSLVALGARRGD